jgi:broad specificity phosphatase PhoE
MLPLTEFYMIRHGETEANAAKIMAGSIDSPLTQRGRDQAYSAGKVIANLPQAPTHIIHSHLSRARDTATIINEFVKTETHEDPDFAELHTGDWEGASYEECRGLLTGWVTPPNGESFDQFIERLKRGKQKHLSQKNAPVLIVCHGGVFRAFGKIYGLDIPGVRNCHLYHFEPTPTPVNTNMSAEISFPWTVWDYELDPLGKITKTRSRVFHDPEFKIAL